MPPKGKKASKPATAFPVGLLAVILAVIVAMLALLFTFSSKPRLAQQYGGEEDVPNVGVSQEMLKQYEELVTAGDERAKLGETGAKEFYIKAADIVPQHPLAHFNLARLSEEEGDLNGALEKYNQVLRLINPSMKEGLKTVHTNIALALMNANRISESIEHWEKAIRAAPKEAMLHFSLANAHSLLQQNTEALAAFEKSAKLDPKEAKYLVEYGRMLRTIGGQDVTANEAIEKGLAAGNEQQLFQLGMYLRQKDDSIAQLIFERIIERFPQHPALGSVYYMLGQIYGAAGRTDDEKQLYQNGVEAHVFPSALQRPMYFMPSVPESQAFPDTTGVEGAVELLEENAEAIIEELTPHFSDSALLTGDIESISGNDQWHQLVFVRNGILNPTLPADQFPLTRQVLDKIHDDFAADMPRSSMELSVLNPGGHIKAHCGPVNYRRRLHLGLDIPEGAAIRAGTETRTWQRGHVLVLDDSFEHEVWNNATTLRAVLLVDVWHPALTAADRDAVRRQFAWDPRSRATLSSPGGH